jgi:TatD DNase family protein
MTADIADAHDIVYATMGLHPWIATSIDDETYRGFLDLAKRPKVIAVGEIGLDANRSRAGKDVQVDALIRQLQLARETDLPVFLHERGYRNEMLEVLSQYTPPRAVVHGFRGSPAELWEWLDFGYAITVNRIILEADGEKLKSVVAQIPADRLLLETDGVTTTEEGALEGQARVVQVAQLVGKWRGSSAEEIGELSTRNLKNLLKI